MQTPRGTISVMEPSAYQRHLGVAPPDLAHGARLAALIFAVRDRAQAAKLLVAANIPATEHMGRVVVGPSAAMGATIVFEQS